MTADIFIPEDPMWIHFLDQLDKVVEAGVQLAEVLRSKLMFFRPVWSTTVPRDDVRETSEVMAIRDRKVIGSHAVSSRAYVRTE